MIKLLKFQRWNIKGTITEFNEGQVLSEDSLPERTVSDMLRLGYAVKVNEKLEVSESKKVEDVDNKIVNKDDISNKKLGKKGRPKKGVK